MIKKAVNKKKNKEMQNKINLFLLKYFSFIVALMVILLLYAGYFYIIKVKQNSIKSNIEVANEDKENDKLILKKKLEKLKEYRLAYESIGEAEKKRIDIMIPEEVGKDLLFTNMEVFILRQGLILDSVDINKTSSINDNSRRRNMEASDADVKVSDLMVDEVEIDLSISGIGGYEHFKKVLYAFEHNLQILDINKLDCDLESGTLNLAVTAYYLKGKQDVDAES